MSTENAAEDKTEPLAQPEFTLYLFPCGRARIACLFGDDSFVQKLAPRFARIMLLLKQAYEADGNLPVDIRGLRSSQTLAKLYDENRYVTPPKRDTVTTYLGDLRDLLKTSEPDGRPFPSLIHAVSNDGVRLLHPVKIVRAGGLDADD